jgi:ribosome-associated protein
MAKKPALQGKKTATTRAKAATEKGAARVTVLDVTGLVGYTDFVVICQAQSDRQARGIADHVVATMKAAGQRPFVSEGYEAGQWILVDFSDVITHIFLPDVRDFYDLDGLWVDAPRVTGWEDAPAPPAAPAKKPRARKKGATA